MCDVEFKFKNSCGCGCPVSINALLCPPDAEGEVVLEEDWKFLVQFQPEAKDSALVNLTLNVRCVRVCMCVYVLCVHMCIRMCVYVCMNAWTSPSPSPLLGLLFCPRSSKSHSGHWSRLLSHH